MFWFGKNWKNYVENAVNEKVIEEAKQSLLKYLPEEEWKGVKFVDIGCGSGLFSLAALLLGVDRIVSFDIQKESIKALELLIEKFENMLPRDYELRWSWFVGDILDEKLITNYAGEFDIVYSWGVLHHTSNMWKAIINASKLVKQDGYLIIAIYNHAPSSHTWEKIKKFYNNHKLLQPLLGSLYGIYVCLGYMIRRRTFSLYRERGMHVFYDAIDWIGGYPYEYACFEEVREFVENLGFKLINSPVQLPCGKNKKTNLFSILRTANTGCNEYVFKKI